MGKLNLNKMKQVQKDLANSSGFNADYDKLESGNNVRRVLPPKGDSDSFFVTGFMHFGLGEDGKRAATCLRTYGEKNCPICAYTEELKKSRNKEDKEYGKRIESVKRTYINVINRDSGEDKPLVLPIAQTVLKGIIDLICDPDYGDITDFDEGVDITIKKEGSGLKTKYTVTPKRKESVATEEYTAEELDEAMTDLTTLFREETEESLQDILDGVEDDEPSSSRSSSGSDDYDEMDVDELIDLCEERGIDLPAKPTRLKLIKALQEADEFDSMTDDEDDEPAPPKRTKPAAPKSKSKPKDDEEPEDTEPEEDDEGDDLQDEIAAALARRKNKGKK